MEIVKSQVGKIAPRDYSKYERTYNNAIDLVAQCVGFHRLKGSPLKAIVLKPASYELFRKGIEFLMKQKGRKNEPLEEMTFENVAIKRGDSKQFDTMICEFYDMTAND